MVGRFARIILGFKMAPKMVSESDAKKVPENDPKVVIAPCPKWDPQDLAGRLGGSQFDSN